MLLANNKRLLIIVSVIVSLLLVPAVAMRFTTEVSWTLFDFAVAGALLSGAGLTLELALRKLKTTAQRTFAVTTLFLVLFFVWAELAVGIFGSPLAGN